MIMIKKIVIWLLIAITSLIVLLLILAPPIAKNYFQSHSEELIGRKVIIDKLRLNLFNGKVWIYGVKMMEKDGQNLFIGFDKLYVNLKLSDLFRLHYTVQECELAQPIINIVSEDGNFNFDDLLESPEDTTAVEEPTGEEEPVVWTVKNILLSDGEISYNDDQIGTKLELISLDLASPGISWDSDTLVTDLDFALRSGGAAESKILIDLVNYTLSGAFNIKTLNLRPLTSSVQEFMMINGFEGLLSTRLDLALNLEETSDIALKGDISLDSLRITDDRNEEIVKMKHLLISMDTLDLKENRFEFSSIHLERPEILVEYYDDGDNWSRLFPETESDSLSMQSEEAAYETSYNVFVLLSEYIRSLALSYMETNYRIESFQLNDGVFHYNDYTLQEVFSYKITEMSLKADHLYSDADTIRFDIRALLNGESEATSYFVIEPQNLDNFVLDYKIKNTSLSELSPYTVYYISYPINFAILDYLSHTTVLDGNLKSDNKIVITDFRFGNKVRNATALDIPVKLAVSLLKDMDGNINLEIPVEGDLNDPKFKIRKVIWGILKNIVVKVATAPWRILAETFKLDANEIQEINYDYLQTDLNKPRLKTLDNLALILEKKEDLVVELIQIADTLKEEDEYAMLEGRKRYYASRISFKSYENIDFTGKTLEQVKDIDIRDSLFVVWVNDHLDMSDWRLPIQKKCRKYIGEDKISAAVLGINKARQDSIFTYLQSVKGIPAERIAFTPYHEAKESSTEMPHVPLGRPLFLIRFGVKE